MNMFSTEKILFVFLIFIGFCYGNVVYDDYRTFYNKQVRSLLDKYESGNYSFEEGTAFEIYEPEQTAKEFDSSAKSVSVLVHPVEGRDQCLGLTTKIAETIVLDCPDMQPNEPGCFYVLSSSEESGKEAPSDETKIEKKCVEVLNERCVGLVTPNDWTLQLECTNQETVGKF